MFSMIFIIVVKEKLQLENCALHFDGKQISKSMNNEATNDYLIFLFVVFILYIILLKMMLKLIGINLK